MRFETGRTILHRDVHSDGRIRAAVSARVVAEDERGVLTWTAMGSEVMWRTTLAGDLVRKYAVAELDATPTMLSPSRWSGTNVLRLIPPDSPYSVWWFFNADCEFFGWYINLETPSARWSGGLDVTDLDLDIWVEPDRTWNWKDEDEFAERIGHPEYWTAEEAAEIRAEGERVIALVEAGAFPFDGTFTDFKPDPSWAPETLPPRWDLPAAADGSS